VSKAYAVAADLKVGQKVELPILQPVLPASKQQDRDSVVKAFQELQVMGAFSSIKDPVAWQREIRKDRPLPGRG